MLGPACAFDAEARDAFSKLIERGYVQDVYKRQPVYSIIQETV